MKSFYACFDGNLSVTVLWIFTFFGIISVDKVKVHQGMAAIKSSSAGLMTSKSKNNNETLASIDF
jgi:hypothetical protein